MRIKQGSLKDFDQISRINDACFFGVECPPAATLRSMITMNDVWIAYDKVGTLGYAIVQPDGMKSGDAYLWQLAVAPLRQRQGVGGNILHHLSGHYKFTEKKKTMSLHVHPDNASQKLYFDYGFRVIELARKYYVDSDGLVMRKSLV